MVLFARYLKLIFFVIAGLSIGIFYTMPMNPSYLCIILVLWMSLCFLYSRAAPVFRNASQWTDGQGYWLRNKESNQNTLNLPALLQKARQFDITAGVFDPISHDKPNSPLLFIWFGLWAMFCLLACVLYVMSLSVASFLFLSLCLIQIFSFITIFLMPWTPKQIKLLAHYLIFILCLVFVFENSHTPAEAKDNIVYVMSNDFSFIYAIFALVCSLPVFIFALWSCCVQNNKRQSFILLCVLLATFAFAFTDISHSLSLPILFTGLIWSSAHWFFILKSRPKPTYKIFCV